MDGTPVEPEAEARAAALRAFRDEMEILVREFDAVLPERIAMARSLTSSILEGDLASPGRDEGLRTIHHLAGSAGTFRRLELSRAARDLENEILAVVARGTLTEEGRANVTRLLSELEQAAQDQQDKEKI
ncbi:MAG: Hpt domain-containing protein [Acidobacteria bacterium]|nr:Hpt domain-containing protein [Acidobacteriota bacterium]